MPAAQLPVDESVRLATLLSYRVLDTPPDPRFDQLVELAAEILGTPMAALTLIDDTRQWLKSEVGIGVSQTPREDSFCAHTILQPDRMLVVDDASRDDRFADHPHVLGGLKLRFYAGMPVTARNGQPLGALCVLDVAPRRLDQRARSVLRRLASQAGELLELHRQTELQQAAATHDPLTDLANQRWFETMLVGAVQGALAGRPFGIILLDLDHFRSVNESLGHDAGDAVLVEVARRLQGCVRGADMLGRLNGDRFAVLVSGPVEFAEVVDVANRIEGALSPALMLDGTEVPIKASIGLAVAPNHGLDVAALLRAAEQALHAAKTAGGAAIQLAGAGPTARPIRSPAGNLDLQTELSRAIDTNGLHFNWQPIFTAEKTRRVGYEALLRWDRPGHGLVPPATFIPLAEATDLIGRLDAWVLEHACAAAASWQPPLQLSVNMSAFWFGRSELIRLLRGALARSGLSPERLVIELTERTLIQRSDATLRRLHELRDMGVRLALDDFGMGYSSFGYLRQFAFDELKLDRDFVRRVGEEPRADAIAKAIVELGHSMNMTVCGEGVETAAQLASLQRMGCDLVQGYLLGRPAAEVAPSSRAEYEPAATIS